MSDSDEFGSQDDQYGLERFILAQEHDYAQALAEIKHGRKRTHWMWYIFPQVDGLAFSSTSRLYSIKSIEEAKAYLEHPVLGPRLRACFEAVLNVEGRSASEIFGSTDALKLKSCATLFACVSPHNSPFERLLSRYFSGSRDDKTLAILGISAEANDNKL